MKKLYDRTIMGYYVMSVVTGLLMAFAVAMLLEIAVVSGTMHTNSKEILDWLDAVWKYLPLHWCDDFYGPAQRYWHLGAVACLVTSVGFFVRMPRTEDGHKKVLQTLSVALLVILLMLTYEYSVRGWIANAALAAIPGLLTAFPFFILRKTQLPHESVQQVWSRLRNHPGFYVGLACVVVGLFALYALIQYGLYLLGTLKTQ